MIKNATGLIKSEDIAKAEVIVSTDIVNRRFFSARSLIFAPKNSKAKLLIDNQEKILTDINTMVNLLARALLIISKFPPSILPDAEMKEIELWISDVSKSKG